MTPTPEQLRFLALDQAARTGDLAALRTQLADCTGFPNVTLPLTDGPLLALAIAVGPASLVRELLALGADPNYPAPDGYPSLLLAMDGTAPSRLEVLRLLLAHGADVQQRGINDYTPLHFAAARNDVEAVALLLAHGADPGARTGIDDWNTPLEEAELLGCSAAAALLRARSEA